jgi:ribosome-associated protein
LVKTKAKAGAKKKPAKKTAVKKPAAKKTVKKSGGGKRGNTAAEEALRDKVIKALDSMKAEGVVCVDVRGQSSLTDFFIIASGRSNRQVKALAETARKTMIDCGLKQVRLEGTHQADWVVVDGGDVIVHLFRPEVRLFYRLEEVWGLEPPLLETFKSL